MGRMSRMKCWWTWGESDPLLRYAIATCCRYTTGPAQTIEYRHEPHVSNGTHASHAHFKNGKGLTMIPFLRTSKCKWVPVERPVEPIRPKI